MSLFTGLKNTLPNKGWVGMKKSMRIIISCMTLLVIMIFGISGTYSWQSRQVALNELADEADPVYLVELLKLDKETQQPLSDVYFLLYRADGQQIGGLYCTDADGRIIVELPVGDYYFYEMTPCVGYTFDEINGEQVREYPFSVAEDQQGMLIIIAYNIRTQGSLVIQKLVENSDGSPLTEAQQRERFTFTVTFNDGGSYTYRIDNGIEQVINGSGTIELYHGQQAVFEELPTGLLYTVIETPVTGYVVTGSGHQGNITEDGCLALFRNIWQVSDEPKGSLLITNEVIILDNRSVSEATEGDVPTEDEKAIVGIEDAEFLFRAIIGDDVYEFVLKDGESKRFDNLPAGTNYEVTEIEVEEGYVATVLQYSGLIIANKEIVCPFLNYCRPEAETGSLTVRKEVTGEGADPNDVFGFEVVFSGEGAPETQTFTLRAGESRTFSDIPVGVSYSVRETDAGGYLPDVETVSGVIVGDSVAEVTIVNHAVVQNDCIIRVTKEMDGEYPEQDAQREFRFILNIDGTEHTFTLRPGETKEFSAPEGAFYELREDDAYDDGHGYIQYIINGCGIVSESVVEIIAVNTFAGEVTVCIEGVKTWELCGYDIELPESIIIRLKNGDIVIAEQEVFPDDNGQWSYSFEVPKYDENGNEIVYTIEEEPVPCFEAQYEGFDVTNIYVPPIESDTLIAEKVVQGEDAPDARFTFVMRGQPGAPMPEGSLNGSKTVFLNGSGQVEFGTILFSEPGTYVYTISESDGGLPNWSYDSTVYTVTYVVTQENGQLYVEQTIEQNGSLAERVLFVNRYMQSAGVDFPIAEKIIIGEDAPKTTFTFVMRGENGAPMPEGSEGGSKTVLLTGAGEIDFGSIYFTESGIYVYTISELNGGLNNWIYDETVYTVTLTVEEVEGQDGQFAAEYTIERNGELGDNIRFVNEYKPSDIVIEGQKTWRHGTNPPENHPDSIEVYLYADGEKIASRQVTAEDDWRYSFTVPEYAPDGHKIVYEIDEKEIADYTLLVDVYDLINIYNPKETDAPDDPSDTDDPDDSDTPVTGDNSMAFLWLTLVIISLFVIVALPIKRIKRRSTEGR